MTERELGACAVIAGGDSGPQKTPAPVFPIWSQNNVNGNYFLAALGYFVTGKTETPSVDTTSLPLSSFYFGGVLGADGKIYAIPNGAGQVAIVDPAAKTVDTTSLPLSGSYNGGVLGADGKIYAIPYGAGNVAILLSGVTCPNDMVLSRYLNKY